MLLYFHDHSKHALPSIILSASGYGDFDVLFFFFWGGGGGGGAMASFKVTDAIWGA